MPLGGSYEEVPPPLQGAAAFQITRADPIAEARFATALEGIADVGVGDIQRAIAADRLAARSTSPTSSRCPWRPRATSRERAGIVVLEPEPEQVTALTASLINHGVTATVRDGSVRLSAHVSTGDETLEALRGALTSFSSSVLY